MTKVGIFFGTDTGNTRRIAKSISKTLGDKADKPINIRNAKVDDLLQYDFLIIGSPTYGDGELPGLSTGNMTESWEEFLPKIKKADFSGKKVAFYGLGDQKKYGHHFISAIRLLYDAFINSGAEVIGSWELEGYEFDHSEAIINDKFIGLALDQDHQKELTDQRLSSWLESISPAWS